MAQAGQSDRMAEFEALRRSASNVGLALPAETAGEALARVEPFLARLGVTRVGDLTGLDTIGIPVWFACRPNSRSLSVSQGKGLTPEQARLSAIMEAAEGAVAERAERLVTEFGSIAEMARRGRATIPVGEMMRVTPSCLDLDRERAWTPGVSWRTGEPVLAPYELIGMDMRSDMPWDHAAFRMSSVGLGAGFGMERAVLHALLELVENDATALLEIFGSAATSTRTVVQDGAGLPALDGVLRRLRANGVEPQFAELTRDIDLPVIGAYVDWPADALGGGAAHRQCAGFACRPDAADAALAAVLEAVQSRLTHIAGSRDDIPPSAYSAAAWSAPGDMRRDRDADATLRAGVVSCREFGGLRRVTDAIFAAGAPDIFVFSLPSDVPGLCVVRVLAPALDAGGETGAARLSARSLALLAGWSRS